MDTPLNEKLQALHDAIDTRNTALIKRAALEVDWKAWEVQCQTVKWKELDEWSPLRWMAQQKWNTAKPGQDARRFIVQMSRNLLRWGANLFKDPELYDVLLYYYELYPVLAQAGKDFGFRDDKGNTALHLACIEPMAPDPQRIKLVLERNVEVNAQNNAGETPLLALIKHMGEYAGQYSKDQDDIKYCKKAVEYLCQGGAHWGIADHEGVNSWDAFQEMMTQGIFEEYPEDFAKFFESMRTQAQADILEQGTSKPSLKRTRRF